MAVQEPKSSLDVEAWNIFVRQLTGLMDGLEEFLVSYKADIQNQHTIGYQTLRKLDDVNRDMKDTKKFWDKFSNIVKRGY